MAGFTDILIEPLDGTSVAAGPEIPAIAYCKGTPLRNEIEALDPEGLDAATEMAAHAVADRFGDSHVEARIRAFVITAS